MMTNKLLGYYHTIHFHNLRKTCCILSVNTLYLKLLPYTAFQKQSFTTNYIWYKTNWNNDTTIICNYNNMHHCVCLGLHLLSTTHSRQHYKCNHTQQNQTLWDCKTIWLLTLYDTMDNADFLFVCTTRTVLGFICVIMEHSIYIDNIQSYRQTIINNF